MEIAAIRLECSRLSINLRHRGAVGTTPLEEVAEQLAKFCGDSETRLKALIYAYKDTDRGTKLPRVMEVARELADFAEKQPAPVHQPVTSTRGGRSRRGR